MRNGSPYWAVEISLAVDVTTAGALRRRLRLQERLAASAHPVFRGASAADSAKRLYRDIRTYLIKASDERIICDSPRQIFEKLMIASTGGGHFEIAVGTTRNFSRNRELPHFSRPDGAWFDFQLTAREEGRGVAILAYDFELRLPGVSPIGFLRFDLNPPDHPNDDDGLRSHVHLNSDDDGFASPAPVLSPFEILDLFLHGLMCVGRIRRTP